ncbi:MAG: hypothetical protein JWQ09_2841 [Segetibacter sp.]|nr:hypothetical protein [Segetibacter sp.]
MPETQCKVGDDYYHLTYNKRSTDAGVQFYGELFLATPLNYEYIVDGGGEITSFIPSGTNQDIINSIKDAIDDFELTQKAGFVD